ncbi:MAG: SLOG family protein [Sedimentibacter sp.]
MLTKTSKLKACCFIEHQPQILKLNFNEKDVDIIKFKKMVQRITINLIENYSVNHYISGVSLGIGQYVSETVLELKKQYPHITLECAIPYERQAENWTEAQRNKYFSIIKDCDKETLLQFQGTNDSIQNLYKYMTKNSYYIVHIYHKDHNGITKDNDWLEIQGENVFAIHL